MARSIEDNDLNLNYAFNTHTQFPLIYHAVAVTTPQLSLQEFPWMFHEWWINLSTQNISSSYFYGTLGLRCNDQEKREPWFISWKIVFVKLARRSWNRFALKLRISNAHFEFTNQSPVTSTASVFSNIVYRPFNTDFFRVWFALKVCNNFRSINVLI